MISEVGPLEHAQTEFNAELFPACLLHSTGDHRRAMRTRRFYILLLAVGVMVVVVALLVGMFRSQEPVYHGRPLSFWVAGLKDDAPSDGRPEAEQAVRHIGTNALPFLLKWISYKPLPWIEKLEARLKDLFPITITGQNEVRADAAVDALIVLRPQADGVVGELTKLLNDPKLQASAVRAAVVLARLGSTGLPPVVAVLTNEQSPWMLRYVVADNVGLLGTNGLPAVAALQEVLRAPDVSLRNVAAKSLQRIDPDGLKKTTP